jgi:serine/threonine protein kinase
MKPENVLLNADLLPVICDFGISKAFEKNSKSVKVQGTRSYLPLEQYDGKVGRKYRSLKEEFMSGYYVDITENLTNF